MKKVLFINMSLDGHHREYLKALVNIYGVEPHIVMEMDSEEIPGGHYIISSVPFGTKNICTHLKWMKELRKIYKLVKPDIIHFVWGDSFYCMMGVGFLWLSKKNSIITFHQVRKSLAHKIAMKIYGRIFTNIIVHTESLKGYLNKLGINNVIHIEYPRFSEKIMISQEEARIRLGIHADAHVLLALGGTRYDKGVDILIKALNQVASPFYLVIAGQESSITRQQIDELIFSYKEKVMCVLRYLSYEEFELFLIASDFVVLPYRKQFDGASGPLVDGVTYGKTIIGSSHGSLGELITNNHIGYTFETENVDDLAKVLNEALEKEFVYDSVAVRYQKEINVEMFKVKHQELYKINTPKLK